MSLAPCSEEAGGEGERRAENQWESSAQEPRLGAPGLKVFPNLGNQGFAKAK